MNIGTRGDVFVLTEEQRHILMEYKRSELLAWTPPRPTEEPTAPPRELGEGDSTWTKSSATTPTTCDEK